MMISSNAGRIPEPRCETQIAAKSATLPKRTKHWMEIPANLNELPPEKIERLFGGGYPGYCQRLVKVPYTGRKERCRYCGGTMVAARMTYHLINHCWKKPVAKAEFRCGPRSGESEWYWEKA